MSHEEAQEIMKFGLTLLQARIYLALIRFGTLKAPQIGTALGIARPEVYRVLRELSTKGLVQRNLSWPSTFTATLPAVALPLMIKQLRDTCASLETSKDDLIRSLSRNVQVNPKFNHISLINRVQLDQRFIKTLALAKNDYAGISGKYGFSKSVERGIAEAIISARKRNVNVRLITEIDKSNIKAANILSRYAQVRLSKNVLFYADIIDKEQMFFGPIFDRIDEDSNPRLKELDLFTNNPRFIGGIYALFERLWSVSKNYSRARVSATRSASHVRKSMVL